MKTKLALLLILNLQISLYSQCPAPQAMEFQDGNKVKGTILNGGDLFWNGDDGQFVAPANDLVPKSSIFAAAIWMGGFDPAGNLKLAAQTYGRSSSSFDYAPGPLNTNGTVNEGHCENFNHIWKVTKAEIEAHQADFADNGTIDTPIPSIFGWPGRNNFYFFTFNGFLFPDMETAAPFFDQNGDNQYDPHEGDYPHPPHTIPELAPASMTWSVFNDNTIHSQSGGNPIIAELQLTSWSFDCFDNPPLSKTIFTSHKIINKSAEALDSFHVALWVDFDLGCYLDDFIGSYPDQNAFFTYNADDLDGVGSAEDCAGVNTYGEIIPTQSIQFLNKEMDYFMLYGNEPSGCFPINNMGPPLIPYHNFNLMTGHWRDTTPLVYGGVGYDFNGDGEPTNYIYPGDPNNPNQWSLYQDGALGGFPRSVASTDIGAFDSGQIITIDMAYTFHRYSNISGHLEIVEQMYPEIDQIQQMYDMEFNSWCGVVTDIEEIPQENIEIFPNPSTGIFNLKTDNAQIYGLELFDISGKLLWQNKETIYTSKTLDFGFLNNGIYVLQVETADGIFSKKLIVSKGL